MIYPAVKKYSDAKKYLIPMAIGAGTGVGARYLIQNSSKYKDRMSPEAKTTGLIGGAIGGAGVGLTIAGSFDKNNNRTLMGLPFSAGGLYLMTKSNKQIKEETKSQSLGEALFLPTVGAGIGAGKALYENNYGSMKDMPRLNKRYNLIGSSIAGFGGGQAIAYKNPLAGGFGLAGGIMGLELANRSKYGPRLEDPVAGDGSSTVAAVNGSGI